MQHALALKPGQRALHVGAAVADLADELGVGDRDLAAATAVEGIGQRDRPGRWKGSGFPSLVQVIG